MKYSCLILDHDDTAVDSTAEIHYPAHLEIMKQLRPDLQPVDLENWFRKNFDPGIMEFLKGELGFSEKELQDEIEIWLDSTLYISETLTGLSSGGPYRVGMTASTGVWVDEHIVSFFGGACYYPTYTIGYYDELADTAYVEADVMAGIEITIEEDVTIDEFGLFMKNDSGNVKMALYDDTGTSGAPGNLVAYTPSTPFTVGELLIDIEDVDVSAGTYWLMAVYDAEVEGPGLGTDATGPVTFVAHTFGDALPDPFGTGTTVTDINEVNYFVVAY